MVVNVVKSYVHCRLRSSQPYHPIKSTLRTTDFTYNRRKEVRMVSGEAIVVVIVRYSRGYLAALKM
jgi:hypothetical protein